MSDGFDPQADAVAMYAEAKRRSQTLRAEWRSLGEPALEMGGSTGRVPVAHPLLAAMRASEAHEARLREQLRRRHPGPSPRATLGVPLASSARLRAVPRPGDAEGIGAKR